MSRDEQLAGPRILAEAEAEDVLKLVDAGRGALVLRTRGGRATRPAGRRTRTHPTPTERVLMAEGSWRGGEPQVRGR